MENLKIEYIEIEKLTPYKNNSKIHTKSQIEHIMNSITKFGFNDPLGICGKDNIVLEGNGRIEAAKLLEMQTLPCVRLDHLNEEEQRAYVIAHNSTTLSTGFDEGVLFAKLNKLQKNFDLNGFGLKTEKFEQSINELQVKEIKKFKLVHYLITLDLNDNDKIIEYITKIRQMTNIEVDSNIQ